MLLDEERETRALLFGLLGTIILNVIGYFVIFGKDFAL